MKILMSALLAAVLAVGAASARVVEKRDYGNWTYEYNVTNNVTSCIASRYYSNAQFSVRFYGNTMDVIFWRNDFGWPWEQQMGVSEIRISGRTYRLRTNTPLRAGSRDRNTGTLFLNVRENQYNDFFYAVKRARNLQIVLWNGNSYPVDLTGSSRALDAALNCWERRRTGT